LFTSFHNNNQKDIATRSSSLQIRTFSGKKDDGDDPFGLSYKDSTKDNLGSKIPPSYSRDETTGKFTGEVEREVTAEEAELLNLNAVDAERRLVERFTSSWEDDDDDDEEDMEERMQEMAERVREEKIAMSAIGRAPSKDDDDDDPYSSALSPSEASALREFLKKRYNKSASADALEDDIPIHSSSSSENSTNADTTADLDLAYLSPSAQAEIHSATTGLPPEDPFLELMPHDLNPTRHVNRRRAKPVPEQLLHHNNLTLLRRYVTPGGQIMNRVQSRLGAKDQRKLRTLVKRARALGLVPYMGQWKYEDHGDVSELDLDLKKLKEDLGEEKEWEVELKRRGLEIEYKPFMSREEFDKLYELEQRILGDGAVVGGEKEG